MSVSEHACHEEEHLLAQVCDGDDTAFAALFERYMPMLRQETARIRCNLSDNDDLVQEASLGLLSAAKAYRADGSASFATFARVCVRRRLINVVRSLSNTDLPQEDVSLFGEIDKDIAVSKSDPDEWIQHKEEELVLLERLKTLLSDMEYRVLVLHLAGYSYDEIARSLDMSAKAVDNALQRIRRKLKQAL